MREEDQTLLAVRPRLEALTLLRFLAALWVMSFHINGMGGFRWAPLWVQGLAGRGYVAVTFFFMLSGFILVYTYGGKDIDLKRFWNARLARLYPVYLLSLILAGPFFAFAVLQHFPVPFIEWFADHLGLSALLALTMQQSWVPQAALGWNGVCWAVSTEVFFYVVFPVVLKPMARLKAGPLALLALVTWIAALALAGLYIHRSPDGIPSTPWLMPDGYFWLHALKFNPLVRLPEFLAGMACGLWFLKGGHASLRSPGFLGAGAALLLLLLACSRFIPYPLMHTGLAAPAFALIILGLALRPAWAAFSGSRFLTLLGESSYSLFLLHCIVAGSVFLAGTRPGQIPAPPGPGKLVFAMLLSVIIGVVVFRWVEEPLRKRIRFGKAKA
jgi:peptidoglycan/LPS O-acetylase OafA/YrhL